MGFDSPSKDRRSVLSMQAMQFDRLYPQPNGLRVLLVEDNALSRKLLKAMMLKTGAVVDTANNGRRALEKFSPGRYQLVFMDVNMPYVNGLEATRLMREQELHMPDELPACIVGVSSEPMAEACLAAGMNEFIAKPAQQDQVQAVIACYHRARKAAQADDKNLGLPA
ncbi:MAG: response regulator, partial [Cyanobacteria bacterium HKST-UBA06]|nr:response regulator [Cyanobacteria bacterium HKST-UBA06]